MKRLILIVFLLPLFSVAEVPEKIQPKTLVLKPISWYESQAKPCNPTNSPRQQSNV